MFLLLQKKSGTKHLSAITVATLMVWGVGISAEAKGGERERETAGREIEQNEMRQEERRRDDQRKHVGHFIAVRKGLIYPPPLSPHGPGGKLFSAPQ